MQYFKENPIRSVKKPVARGRGGDDDVFVPPEEFQELMKAIKSQDFRDYCEFLYFSGCRPEEIRILESKWFQPKKKRVVIPAEFAKGYSYSNKKDPRIIRLNGTCMEIALRRAEHCPDGLLFLNSRGNPWRANAVRSRFRRLKDKLGKQYQATWFRHSHITNALTAGTNPLLVSKLAGHKSMKMITDVYEHVAADEEWIDENIDNIESRLKSA